MSIKGTKTEQNLLKAFAGESHARNIAKNKIHIPSLTEHSID